jgi:predicted lipase
MQVPFPSAQYQGKVHMGFLEAYHALSAQIFSELSNQLRTYSSYNVFIVGHSLGGAQAAIMAMDLFYNRNIRNNLYVITLGSPRVGDSTFARSFQTAFKDKSWRIVHALDLVPHVPPTYLGDFMHAPREVWESSPGNYHVAPSGVYEDPSGSNSMNFQAFSVSDHITYFGLSLGSCAIASK